MCEDAKELGDPLANVRAPMQKDSKIAERVFAYNSGNMKKVARVDERDKEYSNRKAYHRIVSKYRKNVSKVASSKDNNPS